MADFTCREYEIELEDFIASMIKVGLDPVDILDVIETYRSNKEERERKLAETNNIHIQTEGVE